MLKPLDCSGIFCTPIYGQSIQDGGVNKIENIVKNTYDACEEQGLYRKQR